MGRALQIEGIRPKLDLTNGKKKHDWKTLHGFRKYFKTQTERAMKSLNVEILMGHDIGLANSYYKPTERELLEDYLKAVNLLTLNGDEKVLKEKIEQLNEKSKESKYLIEGKLAVKEREMDIMKNQLESVQSQLSKIVSSLSSLTPDTRDRACKATFSKRSLSIG